MSIANNENILTDSEQALYAVSVNGQIVSPNYMTPQAAQDQIKLLSEAHQSIAEVVPVTADGQQVLLG